MNQFLDYALKYAELGWQVFPIVPRQKVPLTKHGVKDATSDADQIRAWWEKWPNANVAVACGKVSGIYVIDVDVTEAGDVNGYKSLEEFPFLSVTVRQDTPRGGFHAFFHANDPPTNRNSFRPGIDIRGDGYYVVIAPSIHPNGGQYTWEKGFSPWEIQLAEFPDFMRPTTRAPWAGYLNPKAPTEDMNEKMKVALQEHTFIPPIEFTETDTFMRASLYLAECEAAVQGCGGHDKLLWAAVAMVHGFLLTNDQALDLLKREYNPRCVPPWDFSIHSEAKDFERKISEARKLAPSEPPGWLLNDPAYAPVEPMQIDVTKLIENAGEKVLNKAFMDFIGPQSENKPKVGIPYFLGATPVPPNGELDFLIHPPGLVGEICEWINATAISKQPFLTLACTLAFCGTLFGRKIRDSLDTRTNLYCLGIAGSSAGKNHAPKQIRKIAHYAGCGKLIGGDDTASDTAIEECLEKSPATLCMWDEIGFLLAYIRSGANQHYGRVIPQLMKLYSAAGSIFKGKMYADSDNQRTIVQPCFSLYGTSTPERLTPGITPEQLQDGWLSRCLIFRTHDDPPKNRKNNDTPVPQHIHEAVTAWFARQIGETDGHSISDYATYHEAAGESIVQPPEQIVVPRESEAEKLFIDFDEESRAFGKSNPVLSVLWRKGEENARRIALILAAGENFDNPKIRLRNADYACRLIRYLLLSFGGEIVPILTTNQIDEQKQKLLAIIGQAGADGCSNRILVQKARWSTKKQRSALLADLIEAEEIVAQVKEGKRVPAFWTVENYQTYLVQK